MTKAKPSSKKLPDFQWLLARLQDPSFYPHHSGKTQVIQTHGSLVIIAKPYVYKIKKNVDFGFLDYSTLSLRRLNLERELRYNQKLAPDVYLDLIPLYCHGDRLSWTHGDLVEWVLVMRYLQPRWFLDRRIQKGDITIADMYRVISLLNDFYSQPETQSARKGTVSYLRTAIRNNFRFTKPFVNDLVPACVHASLRRHARLGFERLGGILTERMRRCWRWCHGDLHLDHIHVTPEAIRIYDCIEFNDGLRWIDLANDLGFLAMDLDFYGRSDLARHLLRRSSALMGDATMHQVVDFYKTYRAMVRAKVESLQVYDSGSDQSGKGNLLKRKRAVSYFQLALDYAVTGRHPVVIVILGNIGTGKSTIAAGLADCLGCDHINSDRVRKELLGMTPTHRSDKEERKRLYQSSMTKKTYAALRDRAIACVLSDRSVVLDATFGQEAVRKALASAFARKQVEVIWIELTASDALIRRRLKGRDSEQQVVSDARLQDFSTLAARYASPGDAELNNLVRVQSTGRVDTVMKRVLDELIDRRMDQVLASKSMTVRR